MNINTLIEHNIYIFYALNIIYIKAKIKFHFFISYLYINYLIL